MNTYIQYQNVNILYFLQLKPYLSFPIFLFCKIEYFIILLTSRWFAFVSFSTEVKLAKTGVLNVWINSNKNVSKKTSIKTTAPTCQLVSMLFCQIVSIKINCTDKFDHSHTKLNHSNWCSISLWWQETVHHPMVTSPFFCVCNTLQGFLDWHESSLPTHLLKHITIIYIYKTVGNSDFLLLD